MSGDPMAFHVRRQAEDALTLVTRRTGTLGGWSREARDPDVLRRRLESLARNALVVVARLERIETEGRGEHERRPARGGPPEGEIVTRDTSSLAALALDRHREALVS